MTLETLRARFLALVQPFDVHAAYKRFETSPTDSGGPHIELHGNTFAYVITERGSEYERRETRDPDEVLYWLVSDTTREIAQRFELAHRVAGKDSRRLLFSKHIQLLENIRIDWANQKREEYERILLKYPYNDGA